MNGLLLKEDVMPYFSRKINRLIGYRTTWGVGKSRLRNDLTVSLTVPVLAFSFDILKTVY